MAGGVGFICVQNFVEKKKLHQRFLCGLHQLTDILGSVLHRPTASVTLLSWPT